MPFVAALLLLLLGDMLLLCCKAAVALMVKKNSVMLASDEEPPSFLRACRQIATSKWLKLLLSGVLLQVLATLLAFPSITVFGDL